MSFVSLDFLGWIFLFLLASRITAPKYASYILVFFGLAFIFYTAPLAAILLSGEALLCYYAVRMRIPAKGTVTLVSVSLVFGAFLLFKTLNLKGSLILPLGISYFTFRLIHYVEEGYRQRLRDHQLIEFLAYMTFFPTYLAGPINLFPGFLQNLRRRTWNAPQFSGGLERIVYGYAQLVVLGNYGVNYLLKNGLSESLSASQGFGPLVIQSFYLWLDLYIRFSAYSSIAIGIAAAAGFTVPENFNFPLLATNIREFWNRWHISLTSWCREYIFIPVAAITRKPFIAIGATMITIGIWHELSLRYILWGVYHALGITVYENFSRLTKGQSPRNKILHIAGNAVGVALTLAFVILSFPVTTLVNSFIIELFK